jgi:hypothetical protein
VVVCKPFRIEIENTHEPTIGLKFSSDHAGERGLADLSGTAKEDHFPTTGLGYSLFEASEVSLHICEHTPLYS